MKKGEVLVKRFLKNIFIFSLSFVFIFSVSFLSYCDNLNDAKNKLGNVNSSIDKNKSKVNDINKSKDDVQSQISDLDSKINAFEDQISDMNENIKDLNNAISINESDIAKNESSLKSESEIYKKRIRAFYEAGNASYIEIALNSQSVENFINRVEYITRVMQYDRNLINDIKSKKKTLNEKNAQVKSHKKNIASVKQDIDSKSKDLQSTIDKKSAYVKSLENDKEKYLAMIDEEQKESQNITSIIQNIQTNQKAAEEKAKKEQSQSNKSSSGSSSNKNETTNSKSPSGSGSGTSGQASGGNASKNEDKPASSGKYFCVTGHAYGITSPYGYRIHPIYGTRIFHAGIDIGVPSGTPIHALADGVIIYSGWMSGYGNTVMIDHGNVVSLYGHNSSLAVSCGQHVAGGQVISYSGSTGNSTGPHLHFEVRNSAGQVIDPNPYYIN